MKEISRRDFLKLSGLLFGTAVLRISPLGGILEPTDKSNFLEEINGSDSGLALNNVSAFFKDHPDHFENLAGSLNHKEWFKLNTALIYVFKDLVDEYKAKYPYSTADFKSDNPRPSVLLGGYVKKRLTDFGLYGNIQKLSDTFNPGSKKITFDKALISLDDNTYQVPDRPLECVPAVILFSGLNLPISPKDVSGCKTSTASGILSDEAREALKIFNVYADKVSGLLFVRVYGVSDVEVGDCFIRYGGNNNHIGTIIGKKVVNGETYLLKADANLNLDGRISVSEVNKYNFADTFGDGKTLPAVVSRNTKVQDFLNS